MLIFNSIEAGVLPLLKTIKILYRADFCLFFYLFNVRVLWDSVVCFFKVLSIFHLPVLNFVAFSQAALSLYHIPLTMSQCRLRHYFLKHWMTRKIEILSTAIHYNSSEILEILVRSLWSFFDAAQMYGVFFFFFF